MKNIKKEILGLTKESYNQYFRKQKFISGKTKLNYAGRVFYDKELVYLVDSSLDFWLTYRRYSKDFENNLAYFLGVKNVLLVNSGSSANLLAFMVLTSLKNTDKIMNDSFWVGVYPGMSKGMLKYIIKILKNFILSEK